MKPTSRTTEEGCLRDALIDAAAALLKEHGQDGLSIRKVAAHLGVSHAAPGYYFRTLADLRTAVATKGFRRLTETMRRHRRAADASPHEQLLALCAGYLAFSREEPALFHLIFGDLAFDRDDPEFAEASSAAYAELRDACAHLAPSPINPKANELFVWSLAHGYASLTLKPRRRFPQDLDARAFFESYLPKPAAESE